MYGWRARLALLIAHSNTTMEPEFYQVVPEGVSVHAARVRAQAISVDGLINTGDDVARAVADLSDIDAASFVFACTSANFVGGVDNDLAQSRQIEELTGRPAITAATAVLEALHAIGARRVAVATPYPDELDAKGAEFLTAHGIEVVNIGGTDLGGARRPHNPLAASPVSHVGLQPPEVAYRLGRKAYVEGAEAVLISGANLPTMDTIATLESDLGVPVVTSGQACIWAALQLAGVRDPIRGYGRLLEGPAPLLNVRRHQAVVGGSVNGA